MGCWGERWARARACHTLWGLGYHCGRLGAARAEASEGDHAHDRMDGGKPFRMNHFTRSRPESGNDPGRSLDKCVAWWLFMTRGSQALECQGRSECDAG